MFLVNGKSTAIPQGATSEVCLRRLDGRRGVRIWVKNTGTAALQAAKVQIGPTATDLVDLDTTTFAALGNGVIKQLSIADAVEFIRIEMVGQVSGAGSAQVWISGAPKSTAS